MDCKAIQEQLSAFLDGELKEHLSNQISRHLDFCTACQMELRALERLDAALASLKDPKPRDLTARVVQRLHRPTSPWRRSLALAACLVLGIFLGSSLTGTLYSGLIPVNGNGDLASIEIFQDYPQGSVGGVYFDQGEDDNSA